MDGTEQTQSNADSAPKTARATFGERCSDMTDGSGLPLSPCKTCGRKSAWSIANVTDDSDAGFASRVDAFACGRHLHSVLRDLPWELDVVEIRDMTEMEAY